MTANTPSRRTLALARARPGSTSASRAVGDPAARADHRRRLLSAAQRLVCEDGAEAVTIESVCAAARASRSTFYSVFADRTDCLLAVFDQAAERAGAAMLEAYRAEDDWLDGLRAALFELLGLLDRYPRLARLMVVGSLTGEPPMLARRTRVLKELAEGLEAGRPETTDFAPAPFGPEAVVGSVAAILHGRLIEEPVPCLHDLGGALMAVLVLPYLGADAARDELSRPLPSRSGQDLKDSGLALDRATAESVGMRVTQRTLLALQTIAERPGLSNREIASTAGIADDGQVSRLLSRLRRLGLVENLDTPPASSKAWQLTSTGAEVIAELGPVPQPGPRGKEA